MNIDKMQLMTGIDNPETYYCTVWLHTAHHSEMAVRVMSGLDETPTTQKFYWIFTGVIYYEGPLKWQSADFYFDTECANIVKKLYPTLSNIDDLINKGFYKLFKFRDKTSSLEVKIIASGILRTENLPKP